MHMIDLAYVGRGIHEELIAHVADQEGYFADEGVHVADQCSCSDGKIRGILQGFSAEEIKESIEDGRIRVNCEFCSKAYEYESSEFVPAE